MLPALVSQMVVVLKDSALGQIITYPELLRSMQLLGTALSNPLQALTVAAVIFIVINFALTSLAQWLSGFLSSRTSGRTNEGQGIGTGGIGVGGAGAVDAG
jgi:glutamate transport system permease protein